LICLAQLGSVHIIYAHVALLLHIQNCRKTLMSILGCYQTVCGVHKLHPAACNMTSCTMQVLYHSSHIQHEILYCAGAV